MDNINKSGQAGQPIIVKTEQEKAAVNNTAANLGSTPVTDPQPTMKNQADDSLPYTHGREVRIRQKETKSLYVQRNLQYMPIQKHLISSSIDGTNKLMANIAEMNAYMPAVIGISSNHTEFYTRCRNYFDAISVEIPDSDKVLNCTFIYYHKSDYNAYEKQLSAIFDAFTKAPKHNTESRDIAFKIRDTAIIKLESEQYKYGYPENIPDYVLYRYCLHYSKVVNDVSLVNSSGNIIGYIVDERFEQNRKQYLFDIKKKAHAVYSELSENPSKLSNILYGAGVYNVDKLSKIDKMEKLEQLLVNDALKLVELGNDKNLSDKAFIERCIQSGILKRLPHTDLISTYDEEVIGSTMLEAISYVNDIKNASIVSVWKNSVNRNLV
jgi:hypothetical protein